MFRWTASQRNDIIADCLAYFFSQFPADANFDLFNSKRPLTPDDTLKTSKDKDMAALERRIIRRISNVFQTATYKIDRHHLTFSDKTFEFSINLKKQRVDCKDEQLQQRVSSIIASLFKS